MGVCYGFTLLTYFWSIHIFCFWRISLDRIYVQKPVQVFHIIKVVGMMLIICNGLYFITSSFYFFFFHWSLYIWFVHSFKNLICTKLVFYVSLCKFVHYFWEPCLHHWYFMFIFYLFYFISFTHSFFSSTNLVFVLVLWF